MLGRDGCLVFVSYRMLPWEEDLPVIIWFRDRWAVFNLAWGALGLHDGASLAYTCSLTLVVAQYRLGTFGFFISERDAQSTKIS